jgi:hypothetical protein
MSVDTKRPWLRLDVDGVASLIPPPDQRRHRTALIYVVYALSEREAEWVEQAFRPPRRRSTDRGPERLSAA